MHAQLQVTLLGERVHGLDIAANTVEYTFAFNDSFQTRQIYHQLSSMCKKAEEKRERERQRPFETPIMSSLLEKCSVVHRIRKGEKLRQASSNSSLFLVCTGEIRLQVKGGDVFRIVGEGACFGEINFALNCTAGHYMCIANARTILLEISHTQVIFVHDVHILPLPLILPFPSFATDSTRFARCSCTERSSMTTNYVHGSSTSFARRLKGKFERRLKKSSRAHGAES
jgi:hypothetical protein